MVEKIYAVFHEANPSQFPKFKNENFILIIAALRFRVVLWQNPRLPRRKIINKMPK